MTLSFFPQRERVIPVGLSVALIPASTKQDVLSKATFRSLMNVHTQV